MTESAVCSKVVVLLPALDSLLPGCLCFIRPTVGASAVCSKLVILLLLVHCCWLFVFYLFLSIIELFKFFLVCLITISRAGSFTLNAFVCLCVTMFLFLVLGLPLCEL